MKFISIFLFLYLFILFFTTPVWAAFPVGWERRCPLTVQHAQVTADQTNFPVLVSYRSTANGETNLPDEMMQTGNANAAQSDGGDIRFTLDAAGTQPLRYEIVTFIQNATLTSAKAEIWVNLPNIYTAADVTFYVWYKGSGAEVTPAANDAAWGSQGVWDSNFKGVWHLPDGTTLTANDSTSFGNGGTITTPTANTGMIDGAALFNGTGDYIQMPSSANYNSTTSTWCFWFKTTGGFGSGTGTGTSTILGRHDTVSSFNGINFTIVNSGSTSGNIQFEAKDGANRRPFNFSSGSYLDNKWHYVCGITAPNGGVASLYVDGVIKASANAVYVWAFNNQVVRLADSTDVFWGQYKGSVDEVRISSIARSASWIKTEYNNQSGTTHFIARGQSGAAGSVVTPAGVAGIGSMRGVNSMTH